MTEARDLDRVMRVELGAALREVSSCLQMQCEVDTVLTTLGVKALHHKRVWEAVELHV
jgi:hypothetical protein